MKYFLILMVGVFASTLVYAQTPPKGPDRAQRPHVTTEPGDQKKALGLYDDAEGPSYSTPYVGAIQMPWGHCYKPAVKIAEDEHGNGIYADDDEVIWRCIQAHPDGTIISVEQAPLVYCFIQHPSFTPDPEALFWSCYHNYGDQWVTYQFQYEKNPLIREEELPYIPEVKDGFREQS